MSTSNNQFMQGAKTALCDWWQQSHQKWLDEQKQKNEAQRQTLKYQSALQLQTELAEIFSNMSAPANLQQIRFTSDLVIKENSSDKNNIYRYRWKKKGEEKIAQVILNGIKNNLNATIMEHNSRLWNTASTLPYPDNQALIERYPFTANGFRITGLFDSPLDVELEIGRAHV